MVGRRYMITERPERKQMEVEVRHRGINTYDLLDTLVNDGYLHPDISNRMKTVTADGRVDVGSTLTIDFSAITDEAVLPSKMRDKRKEQAMARKVMDTLVKQYAPDADTAWDWMRKAHDMGWEWGCTASSGRRPVTRLVNVLARTLLRRSQTGTGYMSVSASSLPPCGGAGSVRQSGVRGAGTWYFRATGSTTRHRSRR